MKTVNSLLIATAVAASVISVIHVNSSAASLDCEKWAQEYKDKSEIDAIYAQCLTWAKSNASVHQTQRSADGTIGVVGYKSLLFFDRLEGSRENPSEPPFAQKNLIAGKVAALELIRALTLDVANRKVFALLSTPARIQSYAIDHHGAVLPLRVFQDSGALEGAAALAADSVHHELAVSSGTQGSISFFSANAEKSEGHPSLNDKRLRLIAGPKTQIQNAQGMAIDPKGNELFVADSEANQILVFDRVANGNAAPLRVISGELTRLVGPTKVDLDEKAGMIRVTNGDGTLLKFTLGATGNVAPL